MSPRTLAMLKMEKNFRAHTEKGYPRKPYEKYSLSYLLQRVRDELEELEEIAHSDKPMTLNEWIEKLKEEVADTSNCLDYLFEALVRLQEGS